MQVILIAFLIILYTMQSFLTKNYTDNYPGEKNNASNVLTVFYGLIVAVISLAFSKFSFEFNYITFILGVINAVALIGYNYAIVKASQTGSYSIMMVFNLSGGIIIPAIVSLFWGDKLSIIQIISILAIFVSIYMISKKDEDVKNTKIFFLFCLFLAICNGAYGALLDAQQRITLAEQKEEMVIFTFMISSIVSLITLIVKNRKNSASAFKQTKISFVYLMASCIVAALAINLLVIILQYVNPTILYTFDNAGVMLLSVLCSAVFFKEKLSKINIIGCVIMCAGLICMSLFNVERTDMIFDMIKDIL